MHKDILHVVTCGSVDAGKSTLVDCLYRESETVVEDQPAALREGSTTFGTARRTFTVRETPSHQHDTLNMLTRAALADAAVVLVDAAQGVGTEARRQMYLLSLLGIQQIVLAVNKMDLVNYSGEIFRRVEDECRDFAERVGLVVPACIPIAAVTGDNISAHSANLSWYAGPTLIEHLESVRVDHNMATRTPTEVADLFECTIVWVHHEPMLQGRSYRIKIAAQVVTATVAPIKYKINFDTLEHLAARKLDQDETGVCVLALDEPIAVEPYARNRALGGFTLLDPITGSVLGTGFLHFALRRSQNVHWQPLDIDKHARAVVKGQRPCVLWFTGLSGAGKSTVANLLEKRLFALGRHTYLLDGDNVRHGLNKDLGFTDADRVENIRRVAEVAKLMMDAGLIVLVSFISPFRNERRMARTLMEPDEFVEIFVDAPLDVAESRDPKGLYKKARRGELRNFTGIDSAYERPEHPELHLDTTRLTPHEACEMTLSLLMKRGLVEK